MFSPLTVAASGPAAAAATPASLLPADPWRKGNGACLGLRCPYPYAARVDAGTFRCRCELQPEQSVLMEQPSQVANATRQWDYYRVPKSGSTAVEAILRACPNVRYHDHGDGCKNLDVCDGRASTGPSFVVLRRPSDSRAATCWSYDRAFFQNALKPSQCDANWLEGAIDGGPEQRGAEPSGLAQRGRGRRG